MSLKELSNYVFSSKYARYLPNKKRRETWHEAVDRVKKMHLEKYPQAKTEIDQAFNLYFSKKVYGSQRTLQFAGEPINKHNVRSFNCSGSYCDRLSFFQETMYILLCGCGSGYSMQKHHVAQLPNLNLNIDKKEKTYVIPDTIEGWADSIGVLLSSYFEDPTFPEYHNTTVLFDYSKIRPKGSLLSSASNGAPGPDPLRIAHQNIKNLLDQCVHNQQNKLRPIQANDIVMFLADSVLSGGVRRSSCINLFSPDDTEMAAAKTGNWFYEHPYRARANNSALLIRSKTSFEEFQKIANHTREFGEPGFIWSDNTEMTLNPCAEAIFYSKHEGKSGWQFCNLCSINGKKVKSKEDFFEACEAAAIIGTLQAGYTDFAYLGATTEEITKREALLGVSITGIMDNPDILLDPEVQRHGAKIIKETNARVATLIGINPAARTTLNKPDGTGSLVVESASGIHPHHAKRYFRNVQANAGEKLAQHFKRHNSLAVQKSVWGKDDYVLTFCVEIEKGAKTKNDFSALIMLEIVRSTQLNWVTAGRNIELCTQPWLNHSVSNTINVRPDEWDEAIRFIYDNRDYFCGVSLLPCGGDKDYRQAPNVAVLTTTEILKEYGEGALFASGLIVEGMDLFDGDLWSACDAALSVMQYEHTIERELWVAKVKKFAGRYVHGDIRKTTYLMKDVYNLKRWQDLIREYQSVDYTECTEEEDNTKPMEEITCAGGACLI